MVHHFAKFMASPQFNHVSACDENCNIEKHNNKKESILEKIIKRVVKK
jgi:hypothetical protein